EFASGNERRVIVIIHFACFFRPTRKNLLNAIGQCTIYLADDVVFLGSFWSIRRWQIRPTNKNLQRDRAFRSRKSMISCIILNEEI
ncbi:hypothetical protein, partial [Ochrobactrum sp. C6C9]|uniref:hypothetical protein n=1 Tax=Ochrobactrum sp. C6C9 TaxID=2736662 RepID=UPI00352FF65A